MIFLTFPFVRILYGKIACMLSVHIWCVPRDENTEWQNLLFKLSWEFDHFQSRFHLFIMDIMNKSGTSLFVFGQEYIFSSRDRNKYLKHAIKFHQFDGRHNVGLGTSFLGCLIILTIPIMIVMSVNQSKGIELSIIFAQFYHSFLITDSGCSRWILSLPPKIVAYTLFVDWQFDCG